jgi:hypothetical protein
MSFFRTLLRPDHDDNPERSLVANAANLLQIGEFQLLQLAYREWYGHDMGDDVANQVFQSFMIQGRLPPWARHYARKITALDGQGQLQINDAAYHRYDNDYFRSRLPDGVRRFVVATTLVVGVIGGGLTIAHNAASCSNSVLPPCFDQSDQRGADGPEYRR